MTKKFAHEGAERMHQDTSQLRIEDFVFPHGSLDPENDRVKLAALVPSGTGKTGADGR